MNNVIVPDGLYDNTSTYRREYWENGEVYSFITAELLWANPFVPRGFRVNWFASWLSYPDLPKGQLE
jgi:hypothetical protein